MAVFSLRYRWEKLFAVLFVLRNYDPQSVRFNHVLTDNSEDWLTVPVVSMAIYFYRHWNSRSSGEHHRSGHWIKTKCSEFPRSLVAKQLLKFELTAFFRHFDFFPEGNWYNMFCFYKDIKNSMRRNGGWNSKIERLGIEMWFVWKVATCTILVMEVAFPWHLVVND